MIRHRGGVQQTSQNPARLRWARDRPPRTMRCAKCHTRMPDGNVALFCNDCLSIA